MCAQIAALSSATIAAALRAGKVCELNDATSLGSACALASAAPPGPGGAVMRMPACAASGSAVTPTSAWQKPAGAHGRWRMK
jgi:hypothetical protein